MIELRYFDTSEFNEPDLMDAGFLQKLDGVRERAGIPLVITSSYRYGDPHSHGSGHAVDIRCNSSRTRYKILAAAFAVGFHRIGVYDRHIHLDDDPTLPQHVVWWGTSD